VNAQGDQWDCGCIPNRACERTGCTVGLEMDQGSIGIALVYVGVCEGGVGSLDCGFVLLHSRFYILTFYIPAQRDLWDCVCIPDRACESTGCPVGL